MIILTTITKYLKKNIVFNIKYIVNIDIHSFCLIRSLLNLNIQQKIVIDVTAIIKYNQQSGDAIRELISFSLHTSLPSEKSRRSNEKARRMQNKI